MGIYINGNKIGGGGASCKKYATASGNYITITDSHKLDYSGWGAHGGIYFRITESKLRISNDLTFANLSEISNIDCSKFSFDNLEIVCKDSTNNLVYFVSNVNIFVLDFFERNDDGKLYVHLYLPDGDYTSDLPGSTYISSGNYTDASLCCLRGVFKYDNKYVCLVGLEPINTSTSKEYTKDFEIYIGTYNTVTGGATSTENSVNVLDVSTGQNFEQEYLVGEITSGAVLNYGTQEETFYVCCGVISPDVRLIGDGSDAVRDDYPTSPGFWGRCVLFPSSSTAYRTMTPQTISKYYTLKE